MALGMTLILSPFRSSGFRTGLFTVIDASGRHHRSRTLQQIPFWVNFLRELLPHVRSECSPHLLSIFEEVGKIEYVALWIHSPEKETGIFAISTFPICMPR